MYSTYSSVVGLNSYVNDGSFSSPAIVALPFKMTLTVFNAGICKLNLIAFADFGNALASKCLRNLKPVPFSHALNLRDLLPSVALLPITTEADVSPQAVV